MKLFLWILSAAFVLNTPQLFAKVTLQEIGNSVILDNGILKVTLDKTSAHVLSMNYEGLEVPMQEGSHSGAYYSWNGGTGYGQPKNLVYSIKQQNEDLIDVSFKSTYAIGLKLRAMARSLSQMQGRGPTSFLPMLTTQLGNLNKKTSSSQRAWKMI